MFLEEHYFPIWGIKLYQEDNSSGHNNKRKNQANYTSLFVKGFLLNIINIGVLVFWLGLVIVVTPNLGGNYKRVIVFLAL